MRWLLLFVVACGGSVVSDGNDGGGQDGNAPDGHSILVRVPKLHRPAGSTCPQGRGAGYDGPDAGPPFLCSHDSECTMGKNGRCLAGGGGPLSYQCSYDECFADSDCATKVPCDCRASASDSAANRCLGGSQCRVDSDCGPGGYCSPSGIANQENCGTEYICHTPADTCIDDSDCPMSNPLCILDTTLNVPHWACSHPCFPPP
jgi:hypothetical protein